MDNDENSDQIIISDGEIEFYPGFIVRKMRVEGDKRIIEAADLMHISMGFRYTPEAKLPWWRRLKAWLQRQYKKWGMFPRVTHCLTAFALSVAVDILFAYAKVKLGWQFHVVISMAFGSVSYLVIYYAIGLMRRNGDGG